MLVGLIPPSSGDAFMCGEHRISRNMQSIRKRQGVCLQHDIAKTLFPCLLQGAWEKLKIRAGSLSQQVPSKGDNDRAPPQASPDSGAVGVSRRQITYGTGELSTWNGVVRVIFL